MLELAGERDWRPPILETVATDNRGIDELWDAVLTHRAFLETDGRLDRRRCRACGTSYGRSCTNASRAGGGVCSGERFDEVVARVKARELDPHSAADELLAGS